MNLLGQFVLGFFSAVWNGRLTAAASSVTLRPVEQDPTQSYMREEPVVTKAIHYVGLDVHRETIAVAVSDACLACDIAGDDSHYGRCGGASVNCGEAVPSRPAELGRGKHRPACASNYEVKVFCATDQYSLRLLNVETNMGAEGTLHSA